MTEQKPVPSVSIFNSVLVSIIDQCYSTEFNGLGLLYGCQSQKSTEETSDSTETAAISQFHINITSVSFSLSTAAKPIGAVFLRQDGLVQPSFRCLSECNHLIQNSLLEQPNFPFLILVVNASMGKTSWIVSTSYGLYAMISESLFIEAPLVVLSKPEESKECVRNPYDSVLETLLGSSSAGLLSAQANASMTSATAAELMVDGVLSEIMAAGHQLLELEDEIQLLLLEAHSS